MAKDDSEWINRDTYVTRDSVFHRRVSEVRNKIGTNVNEAEALEMIENARRNRGAGATQSNPFAFRLQDEKQTITDEEVDNRAFFDDATPTYNFRYILRSFKRELIRARRYKRPVSICVVLLDGLLQIVQQHGYTPVDIAIMSAAETMIRSCRADVDMVGRFAEDRFILLLPETPGTGAAIVAERVRRRIESLDLKHQWHAMPVSASIGISYYPGHGGDVEELIAQADLAAEYVQGRGGNGICYAPENPDFAGT